MKKLINNKVTYVEIAFHLIAITAFVAVLTMVLLIAFTDIIQLPKEEAIEYVLGDPFAKPSNH